MVVLQRSTCRYPEVPPRDTGCRREVGDSRPNACGSSYTHRTASFPRWPVRESVTCARLETFQIGPSTRPYKRVRPRMLAETSKRVFVKCDCTMGARPPKVRERAQPNSQCQVGHVESNENFDVWKIQNQSANWVNQRTVFSRGYP